MDGGEGAWTTAVVAHKDMITTQAPSPSGPDNAENKPEMSWAAFHGQFSFTSLPFAYPYWREIAAGSCLVDAADNVGQEVRTHTSAEL